MPNEPGFLDQLFGAFKDGKAFKLAGDLYPKCHICGAKAVPLKCLGCGKFACLVHSWVNPIEATAVCADCIDYSFGLGEEINYDGPDPWETLGIDEDTGMEELKKAHRKFAKENHPDHGGSAKKFQEGEKAFKFIKEILESEAE